MIVHPVSAARGRAQMLGANLGFASMGLLTRMVPPNISSSEKVFFRSFLGLLLLLGVLLLRREKIGRPDNLFGLLWRGIYGATALVLFFYSIDQVGLVKATLYCYTYPIFAALIAWMTLGETIDSRSALALLLAFVGAILTLETVGWKPTLTRGDLAGLASGMLSGAAVATIRRLHKTETSAWIVIAFTAVSSVVAIPLMTKTYVMPHGQVAVMLLAIAALATIAQILMTAAYRHLPTVEGSVLSLGTVPASAILAMIVLGERPSLRFWAGAALVFAGTVLMSVQKPQEDEAAAATHLE